MTTTTTPELAVARYESPVGTLKLVASQRGLRPVLWPLDAETSLDALPAAERENRAAAIRREILPLVRRRESLADGIAWEFAREPGLRAKLDRFVAFERECCSGLDFEISGSPGGTLRLSIRGEGAALFGLLGTPAPLD